MPEEQKNRKTKVIADSIYLSLKPIISLVLGLFISVIISNVISTSDFGAYSILATLIGGVPTIIGLGMPGAATRYIAHAIGEDNKDLVRKIIASVTLFLVTVTIIAILIIPEITLFILYYLNIVIGWDTLIIYTIAIVAIFAFNILSGIEKGFQNMKKVGLASLGGTVTGQIISAFLLINGFGINALLLKFLIAALLSILLMSVFEPIPLNLQKDRYPTKELLSFGFPTVLAYLLAFLSQNLFLRIFMLNSFGIDTLGLYEFAMRQANLLVTFGVGYYSTLTPYFSESLGKGKGKLQGISWTIKSSAFVFSPLTLGLIFVSGPFFSIFGQKYQAALPLFVILALRILPVFLMRPFNSMLAAIKRTDRYYISSSIATVIAVVCGILFVPLGPVGIALALAFSEVIGNLVLVYYSRKYLPEVEVDSKSIAKIIIGAILMYIPIYFINIKFTGFTALLLDIVAGALIYMIYCRYANVVSEKELVVATSFLPSPIIKLIKKLLIR